MALRSSLLDLPAEIRLSIYDEIPTGMCPPLGLRLNKFTYLSGEGILVKGLASLSRTCKKLHNEIKDVMYQKKVFRIHICDMHMRNPIPSFYPNLSCVSLLRKAHVNFGVVTDDIVNRETLKSFIAAAESILRLLSTSDQLEVFTFAIMARSLGPQFAQDLAKARSTTWKSGAQAGRSYRERELDYAMKAIDLAKLECA
jgi:hypothetical protein